MSRERIVRAVVLTVFLGLVFGFMRFSPWGLAFVRTDSVGFSMAVTGPPDGFRQGDHVLFVFDMDDPQAKGLNKGDILVKKVSCDQGQVLEVRGGRQVFCDGKSGQMLQAVDSLGNPVKPFIYSGQIPDGMMFVTGKHEKSYDSRYWGFARRDWVRGKVLFGFF